MPKLSEQLAELMAEDNLNQSALSKAMNTSGSKISLYLSDKCVPNFKDFVALLEFFNCSADFLVGLAEYPKRDTVYKPVQSFGKRLQDLLKIKETSQYEFIKQTKISWSIFYNWLIEKSLPSIDNLLKVARYFDCTLDYLLGREI